MPKDYKSREQDDRCQFAGDKTAAVELPVDNSKIPDYSLKPWQKLLEILGIGVLFLVLIPTVSLSGFGHIHLYFSIPAFIVVFGCGLGYQAAVVGGRLSLFGRLRKKNRSVAQIAGSLKLHDGLILGGMLTIILFCLYVLFSSKSRFPKWMAVPGGVTALSFISLVYLTDPIMRGISIEQIPGILANRPDVWGKAISEWLAGITFLGWIAVAALHLRHVGEE